MITVALRRNQKFLAEFKRRVKKINEGTPEVHVGLLADGKPRSGDDDYTNAEIAAVHEYGSTAAGIPARPFLRPAIKRHQKEYLAHMEAGLKAELAGETGTLRKKLAQVGAKAAADVKLYVTAGAPLPPPNAPATLKRKQSKTRKGSSKEPRTLVDTAQMINAVTYKLVDQKTAAKKRGKK